MWQRRLDIEKSAHRFARSRMPIMNIIILAEKWSGQNRTSQTGSYAYVYI